MAALTTRARQRVLSGHRAPRTHVERQLVLKVRGHLRPPPKLTVSQWADDRRRLSPEASAEPGRWHTDRAPYQRGMMDAVSDREVNTLVIMSSAQIGKTELVLNMLGYHIDQDPAPILVLQPTLEMAEAFSKDRVAPMLRDTPVLQGKVKDARARDSGNTMLHKSYPGGQLTMAGANSPASLASRPKRVILCDEVDRYPFSAGTEGDPVDLAAKRSTTFYNRKLILVSTPTVKGISRIEKAFEDSDQRYFMVGCPHCGHRQRLIWANVRWPEGCPREAYYVCGEEEGCGAIINDSHKLSMLLGGEWVATKPFNGTAGFHLSELYSPWRKFGETAVDFIKAKKKGREAVQVWQNTALGEPYQEDAADQLAWEALLARCKPYKPLTVPADCFFLTCGVDVQQTGRLAAVVRAWGAGESSSLVYHGEIFGDVMQPAVWAELDNLIDSDFVHASGQTMRITATAVDSGDGVTHKAVYAYCHSRREKNVIAIKGGSRPGLPILGRPSPVEFDHNGRKIKGAQHWIVGTDTAKALIHARLRQLEGNGTYSWYIGTEDEYFKQLLAEKKISTHEKGRIVQKWVRTRPRNEALDCEVYAMAAAHHAGITRTNWAKLQKKYASGIVENLQDAASIFPVVQMGTKKPAPAPVEPPKVEVEVEVDRDLQRRRQARRTGGGGSWVSGWRGR